LLLMIRYEFIYIALSWWC